MDILLPTWLKIARLRTGYLDNTGMTRALYTAAPETTGFGGDRFRLSLEFVPTSSRQNPIERSAIKAFLARLRGRQNRALLWNPAYQKRGSFPASELIGNGGFRSGTTGFSASSANIVLTAQDGHLRSVRASVSGDETIRATVATVVSGATYVARVLAYSGLGAMDYRLRLGTTAGASDIATEGADNTTPLLRTLIGVASGTSMHFSILDGNSGRSIGNFMEFAYASLSRCALVAGGSQVGNQLNIDALPASTDGLLLLGDEFEVVTSRGSELKVVTQPLNSNSSGAGVLFFEPALRGTLADNAPVIISTPMTRAIFAGDVVGWDDDPGVITRASADFEEAA